MAKSNQPGKKGSRKIGRSKDKCAKYAAMHTREKNKVRRVLKSNGRAEAEKWAIAHNVIGYLSTIINRKEKQ